MTNKLPVMVDYEEVYIHADTLPQAVQIFLDRGNNEITFLGDPNGLLLIAYPVEVGVWSIKLG